MLLLRRPRCLLLLRRGRLLLLVYLRRWLLRRPRCLLLLLLRQLQLLWLPWRLCLLLLLGVIGQTCRLQERGGTPQLQPGKDPVIRPVYLGPSRGRERAGRRDDTGYPQGARTTWVP